MEDNEKIEADSDAGFFAEEDWNDPEQNVRCRSGPNQTCQGQQKQGLPIASGQA